MVGTGVNRAASKVPFRSSGLPVAGISVMIWSRMFLLTCGKITLVGSRL